MSHYPISEELNIQTSPFAYLSNAIFPSPQSPLTNESYMYKLHSPEEEWFNAVQQNLDNSLLYNSSQHNTLMSECNSVSEVSSLGIRTPDIELNPSHSLLPLDHPHYYTSLLCQSMPPLEEDLSSVTNYYYYYPLSDDSYTNHVQQQQDTFTISSLSLTNEEDHMMLLQSKKNDVDLLLTSQPQYDIPILPTTSASLFNFDTTNDEDIFLNQLSREQLIERVVQLEMEKTSVVVPHHHQEQEEEDKEEKETVELCKKKQLVGKNENKMYSCHWISCTAKEPTLAKLMAHICESHIGSGKATYFCEWKECSRNKKPFMKRHKMHNHMRTHTGERPFICTVIGCNKTFSRPDSLSTHIKTHSDIRPYSCSMPGCEKAYFHSRSLRKHIKSIHMKKQLQTSSAHRNTPSSSSSLDTVTLQKKERRPIQLVEQTYYMNKQ
ncbi:uncharacterized protein BX663DRAFT_512636 [Cokeromyces recurvatus]|uniref:uncharacterized protein n=1 Tax=Cokeromyces recurvatus TaxID=90255 RepID=UPI00221F101C|nr:uncharacterized protein BX663DRAFT_512636 [Cokeromyces recurvatus]KAI7901856.1 hypothetical protein BX663DRAFT_512636 [Cokeromyces recurvatus]